MKQITVQNNTCKRPIKSKADMSLQQIVATEAVATTVKHIISSFYNAYKNTVITEENLFDASIKNWDRLILLIHDRKIGSLVETYLNDARNYNHRIDDVIVPVLMSWVWQYLPKIYKHMKANYLLKGDKRPKQWLKDNIYEIRTFIMTGHILRNWPPLKKKCPPEIGSVR